MHTKLFKLALSFILVLGLMPSMAFAAPAKEVQPKDTVQENVVSSSSQQEPKLKEEDMWGDGETGCWYTYENGVITVYPGNAGSQSQAPWFNLPINEPVRIVFKEDGGDKVNLNANSGYLFSNEYPGQDVAQFITSIDFSGVDTSSVVTMMGMFAGCTALQTLDLSKFNTSNVTNMQRLFYNCTSLKTVNLSSFNTEKVDSFNFFFNNCSALESVDISNFSTAQTTDFTNMFTNCSSLKEIDLSNIDTSHLMSAGWMFDGCTKLQKVILGQNVTKLIELPAYEIKGHTDWFSTGASQWFTSQEIKANRLGIADTYIKEGSTKQISEVTISNIVNKTYTGSEITQTPRLTDGNKVLIENTDYTLSYKNNINPGTATVFIEGKGGYTGTISKTFTINPKSISGVTVTGIVAKTYTGSPLTQSPRLTDGNYAMREGVDYTLSYKNNVNPGKATVIIKGIGKYTGSVTKYFTITAAIKPSKPVIVVQPKKQITIKSGSTNPFTVSVKAKATRGGVLLYQWYSNGKAIKGATKATFTVKNPSTIKPGTYKLQCVVTEQLLGGKTVNNSSVSTVAIEGPLSVLQMTPKGKSSLEFSWNKVSIADGYDLFFTRCNYGKTTTKYKKIKTIKGANNTTFVKTKLLANTCYKAFVRPFKMVGGKKSILPKALKHMFIPMVEAKNILFQKQSHLTNQR